MDVISVLKLDHRKVKELFKQIEGASPRAVKTKERCFLQIKTELSLHAHAEEEILYPRVKDISSIRHNGFEADEEHALVKQLLSEIDGLEAGSEHWGAKCKVLKDLVEHHVEEEEGEIFPALRSALTTKDLQQMGEAVLDFKDRLTSTMLRDRGAARLTRKPETEDDFVQAT